MVVIFPCGRTMSKQLPIRSAFLTRLVSTTTYPRVGHPQTQYSTSQKGPTDARPSHLGLRTLRRYATASTKTASKPKAHTGRTTVKRTTTKTATKSKAQPKTKKPIKKAKAKPKPKPKAKPEKVKKAPSAAALLRQARQQRTALKERAALHSEPKGLPDQAWQLYISQNSTKGQNATTGIKSVQEKFKRISPEERESLNHTANQNKAKNETAYKQWISSLTPAQVKDINNARTTLLRAAKAKKVKHLATYRPLKDDRLPKRNLTAYGFFFKERYASGDFKGMAVKESSQLVGREWKALSVAQQKPYNDQADADRVRYEMEYKTVFGVETETAQRRRVATSHV